MKAAFDTITLLSSSYFHFILVHCSFLTVSSLVMHLNFFQPIYIFLPSSGVTLQELFCPLFSLIKSVLDTYFSFLLLVTDD